jgi:hypothetical protein
VAQEDHCESCGEPGESVFHVAINCPLAAHFWMEVKNLTGCKLPQLHRDSWATVLSGKLCSLEEAALFICGAWSLWSGCNARKHGRVSWRPIAAAKHVAALIEEMICLNQSEPRGQPAAQQGWHAPERGWIKVNTDAAFCQASHSGSEGAVIRDDRGHLLQVSAKHYELVPDVLMVEALAARDGLQHARACGYGKVILEVDNLSW